MRKVAITISLVLALLTTPLASESAVSHYRRWQASRLLAVVRALHPGITTEGQARAALKSFSAYEQPSERQRDGVLVREVDYQFYNSPEWAFRLADHLRFIPFRTTLPWTLFSVDINFVDGLLAEIHVTEMQEDIPGFLHPNSASVSIFSNRLGQLPDSPYGRLPEDFNGYSEYSRSTGSLDEKGNWTGFSCCHARFIKLDERATTAQVKQALNFQLHCMTSILRCKDDRQILP